MEGRGGGFRFERTVQSKVKAGVIGAGGRLGGKIASEALDRGMDVTAIIRQTPCRDVRAHMMQKDLFDLERKDVAGFDVLFSAFGSGFTADPVINRRAIEHLIEIAAGTGIHVITIGGAGCLYADDSETQCVYELPDHPAFLKGISWNLLQGYEQLCRTRELEWTFVCPSKMLDQDGPRTGDYLTRTDRHVPVNEDGTSYVSYNDLAAAMVDFGEQGLFKRQLVAVASRHGGPHA